jgi:hypothetical protein
MLKKELEVREVSYRVGPTIFAVLSNERSDGPHVFIFVSSFLMNAVDNISLLGTRRLVCGEKKPAPVFPI